MTDHTPTSAPEEVTELGADIAVTRDGLLTIALDDGKTLEVGPLGREAALMLAKMLVDYACPGEALRAAVVAGRA